MNSDFLREHPEDFSGATATAVVKLGGEKGRGRVVVANVGDSRAVLCRGRDFVEQLTVDVRWREHEQDRSEREERLVR